MTEGGGATRPLISSAYRDLNRKLHERDETFGAHGSKAAPAVLAVARQNGFKTVLDYGCGKGSLKFVLPGLSVCEYDPCIPGKDKRPDPADLVVCTDVLEHIEPHLLDNVLDDLASLTLHVFMGNVSTIPSSKTLDDGRNAHLIVETAEWWRDKFAERFKVLHTRKDQASLVFAATPRS